MPQSQTSSTTWAIISGSCLVLGLAVGYVVFGGPKAAPPVVLTPAPQTTTATPGAPTPALIDEQQVQALKNILAKDPKNLQAATQLGNMLYDAGRYADAVPYYQQAFEQDSKNVGLSTDLGTALWYTGRADDALAQYDKSLALDPTHAQTLYNRGIVLLNGKQDPARAVQSWEKLLASNPSYGDRAGLEQLIAQAKEKASAGGATNTPIAPVRSNK